VHAAIISHKIPCFGFVVKEGDISGPLQPEKLKKFGIVMGHNNMGGAGGGTTLSNDELKNLKAGHDVITESGLSIRHSDVCGPPMPGRKVTILGDTDDPSLLTSSPEARNSDVLIHECSFDDSKRYNALRSGHSTPTMAMNVAHRMGAKRIVLNHIGSQYLPYHHHHHHHHHLSSSNSSSGSSSSSSSSTATSAFPESSSPPLTTQTTMTMTDRLIEEQAREALDGLGPGRSRHVHVARDFETVCVPSGGFRVSDDFWGPSSTVNGNGTGNIRSGVGASDGESGGSVRNSLNFRGKRGGGGGGYRG